MYGRVTSRYSVRVSDTMTWLCELYCHTSDKNEEVHMAVGEGKYFTFWMCTDVAGAITLIFMSGGALGLSPPNQPSSQWY